MSFNEEPTKMATHAYPSETILPFDPTHNSLFKDSVPPSGNTAIFLSTSTFLPIKTLSIDNAEAGFTSVDQADPFCKLFRSPVFSENLGSVPRLYPPEDGNVCRFNSSRKCSDSNSDTAHFAVKASKGRRYGSRYLVLIMLKEAKKPREYAWQQ
jgi:hypothetical protein